MRSTQRIARAGGGFRIAPSPFNGVKLELGVILLVGLLLLAVHDRFLTGLGPQLALLGGYGAASAAWLLVRTRRILRREARRAAGAPSSGGPA